MAKAVPGFWGSLCSGVRQTGTSGTDRGCAARGAAQPRCSHVRPGLCLLCPSPGWNTGSLHGLLTMSE